MPKTQTLTACYLRLSAAVLAALLLGAGVVRAVLHLNDLAGNMTHVTGIWMALAQYLNDGIFYPPLHDDGFYAGTRYMPVFFSLIAGTERVTGNYLIAAKLVTLLAMIGLLAVTVGAVWRTTRRPFDAVTLGGLILAFPEGLRALLVPHADALAVAFAIGGLLVLSTSPPRRGWLALAVLLFGLAVATKYSSAAAPAAAVIYLSQRDRKSAILLVGAGLLLAIVGYALLELASGGRFMENFRALGSGGMNLQTLRGGPARFVGALRISSTITFVVPLILPLALLTIVQHFRARGFTLWDWYFLTTIATTLVIYSSQGTDPNHLIEIEIASILVIAQRFVDPEASTPIDAPVSSGVVLAALLMAWFGLVTTAEVDGPLHFTELAKLLPNEPHLLTEDPAPVVLLGQRPVIMDAFAFRLLAERGFIDDEAMVARIQRREFNALILLRRLEDKETALNAQHFGPKVTEALREAYQFDREVGQYYLYRPTLVNAASPQRQARTSGTRYSFRSAR